MQIDFCRVNQFHNKYRAIPSVHTTIHLFPSLSSLHTHSLIGTLIFVDKDVGAALVLQGGLRALVFAMSANVGSKLISIMCLQMLQELARDAENLSVMAAENVINPLKNCKDKYKSDAKVSGFLKHSSNYFSVHLPDNMGMCVRALIEKAV